MENKTQNGLQNAAKEKNYISAVVYLHNDEARVGDFFAALNACLAAHFEHYELVAVDDACTDATVERLRNFAAQNLEMPLTVIHMSLYQGVEQAMNAGLDCAIGDYVFEFDRAQMTGPAELVFEAYRKALTGCDIVSVCPEKTTGASRLFYRLFNTSSSSVYELRTEAFRLVSRRAINRVHAISENLPYRKAAYAASGLRMGTLVFPGTLPHAEQGRMGLAVDSLLLYTDAGYRLSVGITLAMLALALIELLYTLVFYLGGNHPVEGWTTTMLVLTVGFAGVFGILAIAVKYLSLLVDLVFKKQKYLVEGIEKIQN